MVGGCWPTLMLDELENSIRMPINRLCDLIASLGGPGNFFFMKSISNIKETNNLKKEAK